jgi:hypothetical protein
MWIFLFIIKSIRREVKTRPIHDCRCDERLKPKDDESTYLYLCDFLFIIKSIKGEVKTRPIQECRCDERLKTKVLSV